MEFNLNELNNKPPLSNAIEPMKLNDVLEFNWCACSKEYKCTVYTVPSQCDCKFVIFIWLIKSLIQWEHFNVQSNDVHTHSAVYD